MAAKRPVSIFFSAAADTKKEQLGPGIYDAAV